MDNPYSHQSSLIQQNQIVPANRREPGQPVELLAPAGDFERLKMAVLYGADAVYLAGPAYGMRAFAGNFPTQKDLSAAVQYAHEHHVRVYVTVNTMPRNHEVNRLPDYLTELDELNIDALIIGDLGTFTLAERYAPHCRRHVSTQASVCNYETARVWYDLGASRIVLARELSLQEIREIREKTPSDLELEAFVHGAMCVSYSGRCLLSNYMTGRDASRGACAQPCRYHYALLEEKRPGEFFPIEEDGRGAYILNSRDMCMIDHLPDLLSVGLDSLKIEGRAKSAYYAAVITAAYRHGLDDAINRRPIDPVWREEVQKVSHRPYGTGFYYGPPEQYYENSRYIREWQIAAVVLSCDADGNAVLSLRNKFHTGDELELIGPHTQPFSLQIFFMTDESGQNIEEPKTPQMLLHARLPRQVPPQSILRRAVELSARA